MGASFRVWGIWAWFGREKSRRMDGEVGELGVEEGRSPWTVSVCSLTCRWEMIG